MVDIFPFWIECKFMFDAQKDWKSLDYHFTILKKKQTHTITPNHGALTYFFCVTAYCVIFQLLMFNSIENYKKKKKLSTRK